MNSKLRVILTGATGMVGEGVLNECLNRTEIEEVLVVNRKSCGVNHPKLKEIIHTDFFNVTPLENQLRGYNTCFFCLGVSAVGLDENEYYRLTYTLTLHFADLLSRINPDMAFMYISGGSTDSTEKGRMMWARVKGKTENDLMKLPFRAAYAFRPGYMHPTPGLKNTLPYYKYISWMYPFLRTVFPKHVTTLAELGQAMIHCAQEGYEKKIVEVPDIVILAHKG
jgi:nucleoside-diphosphate-sugar epimerase